MSLTKYNTNYNDDITNLRGISVIFVILFHLNEKIFFFGYLGVDIFFIISGYVISLTLHKEYIKNDKINVFNFYLRRIKRLIPSIIVCVLSTYLLYLILIDLIYFKEISKSAFSSIFGFSNIYYLLSNQDYFINRLDNPFIHTWSLGIEEQFYFFYPFILILFYKTYKIFNFNFFFLILILNLFLFAINFLDNSLLNNFYFPLTRFWEILLGCLLFFSTKKNLSFYKSSILIACYFLLCFYFIFFVDPINIKKNIITINSFIFITIYFNNNILLRLINTKFINYIGKISYSLYLYHFPIIFFLSYFTNDYFFYLFSVLLMSIISIINYKLVEVYFRKLNLNIHKRYFIYILVPIIIFLLFNFNFPNFSSFKTSLNSNLNKIEKKAYKYNIHSSKSYNFLINTTNLENFKINDNNLRYCTSQNIKPKNYYYQNCYIDNQNDNLIHLIGDSEAEHLVPMLLEGGDNYNYFITPMLGATFFPDSIYSYNNPKVEHKTKINQLYIETISDIIKENKISYKKRIIIIAGRFSFALNNFIFFDKNFNKVDKKLLNSFVYNNYDKFIKNNSKDTIFIFVPDNPIPDFSLSDCLKSFDENINHVKQCHFKIGKFIQNRSTFDEIIKKLVLNNKNTHTFDFAQKNCNNLSCKFFYEKYMPIYSRKNHFSIEYSKFVSKDFYNFLDNYN